MSSLQPVESRQGGGQVSLEQETCHRAGATGEKAKCLVNVFLASFGVTLWSNMAWENMAVHVNDIGERWSDKYHCNAFAHIIGQLFTV